MTQEFAYNSKVAANSVKRYSKALGITVRKFELYGDGVFDEMLEESISKTLTAVNLSIIDAYKILRGKSVYNPGDTASELASHTLVLTGFGIDRTDQILGGP